MSQLDLPTSFGDVVVREAISGNAEAGVDDVTLADGRRIIVKRTPYDAELEAAGLGVLRAAGAATPEVLHIDAHVLVLDHVGAPPHIGDWGAVGRTLARVHAETSDTFGWHCSNVIGPLPQDNTPTADWPTFYVEHRIRPHLEIAGLPAAVRDRLAAVLDDELPSLLDHGAEPSLVHGDLWAGNVVGAQWLIDPSVHHADREFDLAFAALFGGFPEAFWVAYEAAWPLDAGWERRRVALQLYHLLVHVRLFGASYAATLEHRLDRLGW